MKSMQPLGGHEIVALVSSWIWRDDPGAPVANCATSFARGVGRMTESAERSVSKTWLFVYEHSTRTALYQAKTTAVVVGH